MGCVSRSRSRGRARASITGSAKLLPICVRQRVSGADNNEGRTMRAFMTEFKKTFTGTTLLVLVSSSVMMGGQSDRRPGELVPLQPLAAEVRELETTLEFLGQPLAAADKAGINAAFGKAEPEAALRETEAILDKYALVIVTINPESRVSVKRGPAPASLVQNGTRLFLVKVINQAGVSAPLAVESPNSGPVYIRSTGNPSPAIQLTPEGARERWAEISLYDKEPFEPRLSGFALEYRILLIYSRDPGQRAAKLSFNVGQGTQDVGFLNETTILFDVAPAHDIKLKVLDEKGQPTMASFILRDTQGRIYPNPAKRLAPDFFFQPQIYRANGETISLPAGSYTMTYTGGPEYVTDTQKFVVSANGPS